MSIGRRLLFTVTISAALGLSALGCGNDEPKDDGATRLASFALNGEGTAAAGAPYSLAVSAINGLGAPLRTYVGVVTFESDDPKAVLPSAYSFTPGDVGMHVFTVTFKTAGPHSIHAVAGGAPDRRGSKLLGVMPGALAKLTPVSGGGQGGAAGKPLAQSLVVRGQDEFENGIPNVDIAWAATKGGGSVESASTKTGADGTASIKATLGALGSNQFSAKAGPQTALFDAIGMRGDVKSLTIASGDGQAGTAGKPLGQPLVVKAVDEAGAPYPGVTVAWTASLGGGALPSSSATTGPDGLAAITPTLGQTAGPNTFTATAPNLPALELKAIGAAGPAAILAAVSGDAQLGIGASALPLPLVVKVTDAFGNAVAAHPVAWAVVAGSGAISPGSPSTDATGGSSASATLGPSELANSFSASAVGLTGSPVTFKANRNAYKLVYSDPPAGTGKLRLVRSASSTDQSVVLDLVVGAVAAGDGGVTSLRGYSVGMNLPLDRTKVAADPAAPIAFATAADGGVTAPLDPGRAPSAAMAAIPTSGPLAGHLVSGLSQKADGAGAVATDAELAEGAVLYSVKLNLIPAGAPGVVFDGTAGSFLLPSGGLLTKVGTVAVGKKEIAIGKLVVAP